MESRNRKLGEVMPIVRETVREFQIIKSRITEGEDIEMIDLVTPHFPAGLRANAFDDIVTAWVLSEPGRDWLRSKEASLLTRFHPPSAISKPRLKCVLEMETRVREELEPWKNPELDEDQGDIFPMTQENPISRSGGDQFASLVPLLDLSNLRLTHAAQQRSDFERVLSAQQTLTVNERLSDTIERDAFTITLGRTKAIAAGLDLDAEHVEMRLREWLFTASMSDVPEHPDSHWREVHARNPEWKDLARIGVRHASTGVNKVDVERLIGEQQQTHCLHGMNFGAEKLHARLALCHQPHYSSSRNNRQFTFA
jgi:hypothetical protein